MPDYRKIYEKHYQCSLLPGIDIHHIDGDHSNNDPLNLQAVTLQEHYEIHKSQNDHYAAYMIGLRMEIKPEDWSVMAKENGRKSGKSNYEKGIGLKKWIDENPDKVQQMQVENGKKSGKNSFDNSLGIFSASNNKRKEWQSSGGQASPGFKLGHAAEAGKKGGKVGGKKAKENKTGIFALSEEQNRQRHLKSVITKLVKSGKACYWPPRD